MAASLLAIMEEREISQAQVARLLGRSEGYVSGRLIGKRHLSTDIIIAVAHLAHLTPRSLMVELTERMAREPVAGTASLPSPGPAGDPD